jgi:carbamoyl-phosphate synthase large subunit
MNILLTSVGRRVSLARAFCKELSAYSSDSRVFGTDISPRSAAFQFLENHFIVPRCDAYNYVDILLNIVRKYKIKILIPLIDTELEVLAVNRLRFHAEGCELLVSDLELIRITQNKADTSKCFMNLGFQAPTIITDEALIHHGQLEYPLFLKPSSGSSSIGARRINNADDLSYWLPRTQSPVVQSLEYGEEFTIDVFADLSGTARCAVPRLRWETRGGEISKGITVKDISLIKASKHLVTSLRGCRGCVTLQCFMRPNEEPVFFEANLRFGGGYPLSYAAGANYPLWIMEMIAGEDIQDFDDWKAGMVMLRYDDAIFLDQDPLQ